MQTIILLLALKGTTDFNKTEVVCKEITATWANATQLGIRYRLDEYATIHKTDEELRAELHKHCPRYF